MTQSVSICTAHTSKEKYNGLNRLGYWLMEKKKKKLSLSNLMTEDWRGKNGFFRGDYEVLKCLH